jgi:predicted ATPase
VLDELRIRRFKCFSEVGVQLRELTLLTGTNGAGKSSALQALLLLHQAFYNGDSGVRSELSLNGSAVSLGSVKDVVNASVGGREFSIGVRKGDLTIDWTFIGGEPRDEQLSATLKRARWRQGRKNGNSNVALFTRPLPGNARAVAIRKSLENLRFVPADRVGPMETYPLLDKDEHNTYGRHGERAIGSLYWWRDEHVFPGLRNPDSSVAPGIQRQVEAWLGDIFPRVTIALRRVENANLVTVGIRGNVDADPFRPANVGFGMVYVLPILVALLSAHPKDIVVLENPEAHLHPRAQVAIARLCALAASVGIQVIVETHSDHFLNSIRVSVKSGSLDCARVRLHYFERNASEVVHHEVALDRRGRMSRAPAGFFDEFENQLGQLL